MSAPARRPMLPLAALLSASLILVVGCEPSKKQEKREPILGRRTQDIRDASAEEAKGAVVTENKVPVADPITQSGKTYIHAISKTSELLIDQAINLYHAEKGEYPKDHQQFMDEIIKPNNIALPVLPADQKYAYQPDTHKLVIMKYPEGAAPKAP